MKLYPLKFDTIFKEKIWGGDKIKSILNKDFSPLDNCGETWELSTVNGNISTITNGELAGEKLDALCKEYGSQLLGEKVHDTYGEDFPLLIKFIDAKQDLSVQVHPDDALAKARHNGFGKTEMWYMVQADENASLIVGFNKDLSKEEYIKYLEDGKLMKVLNQERVSAGDCFYIPAGRVHTIGKGCFISEIQQTSDITYRIYDFDRVDKEGNKRELHTEEALDALDFKSHPEYKTHYVVEEKNKRTTVVDEHYFSTSKYVLDQDTDVVSSYDSFLVYIGVKGDSIIKCDNEEYTLNFGEVMLIPAEIKNFSIAPKNKESEVLEVHVP